MFSGLVPLALAHGAALVALTIDEQGMAKTAERKLEVAERTVKTYRARAIEKLGFSSRAEITAYVRRQDLTD